MKTTIPGCTLEYQQERGVLYIFNGPHCVLRISGLLPGVVPPDNLRCPGESMIANIELHATAQVVGRDCAARAIEGSIS